MSKTERSLKRKTALIDRATIYAHYKSKYFNLFCNRFTWEGDIDYEQTRFIMGQLWKVGTIACFKLEGSEGSEAHPQGLAVFCPYAPVEFNIYNFPVSVQLIALRGVRFIPQRPLLLDKEAVIGFAQRNFEPIEVVVDYYCRKLANVEMVIQTNLNSQKYPWIVASGPENSEKRRQLTDMLLEDNPSLFVELDEVDKAKALVSGAPYILDKLHNYKLALENELREYLGLDNIGVAEKKEHLLNEEVAANNEITAASGDIYLDSLTEFCERIREVLGIDIRVKLNQPEIVAPKEQGENPEDDEPEERSDD